MHTLHLQSPIDFKGHRISELVFQPLKVKHLEAADRVDGMVQKSVIIIAAMTGVAESAIRELSMADFIEAQKVVEEALGESRETGEDVS